MSEKISPHFRSAHRPYAQEHAALQSPLAKLLFASAQADIVGSMGKTAYIFKALGDETRLRILSLLLTEGELCVCDILAALNLPQSTISRHLAYLKKTGWVADRRCGLWIYYSVESNEYSLYSELADLLKRTLAIQPTAVADRNKLAGFGLDNNCA